MKKYEYRRVNIYETGQKLVDELNKEGADGWLVVSMRYVPYLDDPSTICYCEVILVKNF